MGRRANWEGDYLFEEWLLENGYGRWASSDANQLDHFEWFSKRKNFWRKYEQEYRDYEKYEI